MWTFDKKNVQCKTSRVHAILMTMSGGRNYPPRLFDDLPVLKILDGESMENVCIMCGEWRVLTIQKKLNCVLLS